MGGGGRGGGGEGSCLHLGTKDKGSPETVKHWVVEEKPHLPLQALSRLRDQPLLPACQLPTLGPLTGPLTSCLPSPSLQPAPSAGPSPG